MEAIKKEYWEGRLKRVKIRRDGMKNLVMNFLATEAYAEAAEKFQSESGTELDIDLAKIAERMAIKKSVQSGNIKEAIAQVNDLNPEILDTIPHVYFLLQQQRFIELIRNQKEQEALELAQNELARLGEQNQSFLEELERTVALLVFEDTKNSPYGQLMEMSHRFETASEVNAAILTSQQREKDPELANLLKMLICAHKELGLTNAYPHLNDQYASHT